MVTAKEKLPSTNPTGGCRADRSAGSATSRPGIAQQAWKAVSNPKTVLLRRPCYCRSRELVGKLPPFARNPRTSLGVAESGSSPAVILILTAPLFACPSEPAALPPHQAGNTETSHFPLPATPTAQVPTEMPPAAAATQPQPTRTDTPEPTATAEPTAIPAADPPALTPTPTSPPARPTATATTTIPALALHVTVSPIPLNLPA